ncbi:PREDICTED: leukocyte cell-derived chemotaxin-2-like [Chaetura pelagica]|uniref:leukocyte cell-derived chemotaxin-2-like n=1 Tax=Chaetura pelagica TaxID=8897 RepID=UPI0005234564|nr:PREDICTED: leukocyte cell-derived chemotaxin-2-like [Chaetura pelagica]
MKMHRVTAIILAIAISSVAAAKWGKVCSSQSANKLRGCDSWGCGGYNSPRGARKHKGVDLVCKDGSDVLAPFSGKIDKQAKPYGNGNSIDNGLQLSGSGFCVKIFYIKPIKFSGPIKKGEKIGVLLPMQKVYRGIISHVHIQNCDLSDPTPYV